MPISQSELDHFHQFATDALSSQGHDLSWDELLSQWRAQQDAKTLASIRRGIADIEADRVRTLGELAEFVRDNGIC